MTIENFKWTDDLVIEFNSTMFAFGKTKEQKIKEFKQMIINKQ